MPSVRVGWRPYVDSGLDTSATAFFAAAGITDSIQRTAINTLVKDLKRFGLWTKIKAFYPFVGGSAASHKFNLIDPRDLDEAYRLQFSGGWTHSSLGVKTNGSNTAADTGLSLRTAFGATSAQHTLGIYINENPSSKISYRNDITASDGSATSTPNIAQATFPSITHIVDMTTNWWSWIFTPKDVTGLTEFKRYHSKYACAAVNGRELQDWRNTTTSPYYNPAATVKIGSSESLNRYCTAYIADRFDSIDSFLMYIAVQKFNTALSRHIGTAQSSIATNSTGATASLATAGMKICLDSSSLARPLEISFRNSSLTDAGVYFMRNDTWPDSSGNSNNGTFQRADNNNCSSGFFYSDDLMVPEVRVHNGVNVARGKLYGQNPDWIETPYSGSDSGTFTFGGWAKVDSSFTGTYFVRGRDGMGSGWNLYMGISLGSPVAFSVVPTSGTIVGAVNAGQINISGTTAIQANTWYNAYVVWKPNNFVKIYLNGCLEASYAITIPSVRSSTVGWQINKVNSSTTISNGIVGAFHVYDRDLSAAEIMQNFNATRGKYNVAAAADADAQAFAVAAGLTSATQISAVDALVTSLKTAGIWTKMKAVYPFVGGTANSHKFNLKDPRNLDAAYRLAFNGGWTHSATGAKPSGTNGFANTYFNPTSQSLSISSQHLSYYSRTNIVENAVEIGAISSANVNFLGLYVSSTSGTRAGLASSSRYNNAAAVDTRGLFIASRTDSSSIKVHVNGSVQASQSAPSTGNDNFNMYIGAYGAPTPDLWSSKEAAFASIGDGLTDAEAASLYTAVQAFQTALGRQV